MPPLPHRVELPFHSFVNVGVRSLLHDDRLSLSTPFTRPSLPERVPDLVLLSVLSCPFYGVTATSLPVSAPRGASRRPLSSRQANSALPSHPWAWGGAFANTPECDRRHRRGPGWTGGAGIGGAINTTPREQGICWPFDRQLGANRRFPAGEYWFGGLKTRQTLRPANKPG